MSETQQEEEPKFESGLTLRSAAAIIFASLAILPVSTYVWLVSGATLASAAVYITVILFSELSILMGAPLRKQEVFIIYIMASIAGGSYVFLNMIYRQYYANSFITWSFIDPFTKKPIPELIPSWWAPPYNSPAAHVRSLLQPAWAIPILLSTLQFGVLAIIQEIALTMICSVLYIEAEKLPFPLARVNAELVTTLAERKEERMHIFTIVTLATMAYVIIRDGIPIITSGMSNVMMQIIPIPWLDLTTGYLGIEKIMPGACFGISTNILDFAIGFVLPVSTLAFMLIGSLSTWTFGNWLALTAWSSYFPEWVKEWRTGMNLNLVWQRSLMRVWIYPQLGFILGLSFFLIVARYKYVISAFKTLAKLKRSAERGYFPISLILLMYLGASGLSVLLFHLVVPDFPLWLAAVLSIGVTFVNGLVGTRMLGEAAAVLQFPYYWQGIVTISNYPKIDAFFFQPLIGGTLTPSWVQAIKTAHLTETKPMDFFKAFILAFIAYSIFSLIYASFFWSMAPIPSSVYPWTLIQWPIMATTDSMWYTRQITTRPEIIGYSFILIVALGLLGQALMKFASIPFSIVGFVTGVAIVPPSTVSMLIGGLIGNYVIKRYMGEKAWNENRAVIVAGVAAGMGIIIGVLSALVIMTRATWIKPY